MGKCNEKKINVMEFLPSFGDGGLERAVANYCSYINKEKYSLFVMTLFSFNKGDCYNIAVKSDCKVNSIFKKIKHWDGNLFVRVYKKMISKKYIASKLKKAIIKNNIKVIHAHNDVLQYLAVLSNFLHKNGIKLIYTCHSFPNRWLSLNYFEEHSAAIKLLNSNNLLICALHNQMADEIKSMFNTKNVVVLENPIDLSIFRNDGSQKINIRKKLNVPVNAFVIGDVCRLVKSKNVTFLIDIFNECYKIDSSCFLVIACNDNIQTKTQLIQKISDYDLNSRILILTKANVLDVLKSLDIFCSPSMIEGFGLSLLEAQASGLKCVYSDIHPKEINLIDSNLVLSLKSDAKYWAKGILSLKNKKTTIKKAINNYDINNVIKKLESLYSN